eukprot:m.189568 g.189568  ORF g.189568 m.189568 type:complete len:895 (+) comp32378_c1_seq2:157-2841(+)
MLWYTYTQLRLRWWHQLLLFLLHVSVQAHQTSDRETSIEEPVSDHWQVFPNSNNVYGKVTNIVGDSDRVKYLGKFPTAVQCWAACNSSLIRTKIPCTSWTWHHTDFGKPFNGACYFTAGGEWSPHPQGKVTSGKGPLHVAMVGVCDSWWTTIKKAVRAETATLRVQQLTTSTEVAPFSQLIAHPFPLSANSCMGFSRNLTNAPIRHLRGRDASEYHVDALRVQQHQTLLKKNRHGSALWTLAFRFRMDKNCTDVRCALLMRVHKRVWQSPFVFISQQQQLNFMITMGNGVGHLTQLPMKVPLQQWCKFFISVDGFNTTALACLRCGHMQSCTSVPTSNYVFDDSSAPWRFGAAAEGSMKSISGFVDDVRLYRYHALNRFGVTDFSNKEHNVDIAFRIMSIGWKNNLVAPPTTERAAKSLRTSTSGTRANHSCVHPLNSFFPSHWKNTCPRPQTIAELRAKAHMSLHTSQPRLQPSCPAVTWKSIGEDLLENITKEQRDSICPRPSWNVHVAYRNIQLAEQWTTRAISILDASGSLSHGVNVSLAIAMLERAGVVGDARALYYLATISAANGTSTATGLTDETVPLYYLRLAASKGFELAQLALAFRYRFGVGVDKDLEIAYGLYHCHSSIAIDQLDIPGEGEHHSTDYIRIDNPYQIKGYGGENNDQLEYVRLRAEQGYGEAQYDLGRTYYWGARGLARDFNVAFRWFRLAAAQQNPDALYTMGVMHRHGQGVEQNVTLMLKYFEAASEQNNTAAMNGLGVYWLHHGDNYTKAVEYFQLAQDRGDSGGAFNRATLHLSTHKDKKGPNNITAAIESYTISASNGNIHAARTLAHHLAQGDGVEENLEEAINLTAKVSEKTWAVGDLLHDAVTAHMDDGGGGGGNCIGDGIINDRS